MKYLLRSAWVEFCLAITWAFFAGLIASWVLADGGDRPYPAEKLYERRFSRLILSDLNL
jgi:hypothetical protein